MIRMCYMDFETAYYAQMCIEAWYENSLFKSVPYLHQRLKKISPLPAGIISLRMCPLFGMCASIYKSHDNYRWSFVLDEASFASNIMNLVLMQPPFASNMMKFQMTFIIYKFSKRNNIDILLRWLQLWKEYYWQAQGCKYSKKRKKKPFILWYRGHLKKKRSFSYRHQDLPRGRPQQPWKVH